MPPRQDKLAAAKLDLLSKWIEQGAPENAGSKVAVKAESARRRRCRGSGKPEGPIVMPVGLFKQPVQYTERPGQLTALAASPWAPLVAVAGQKQIVLYQYRRWRPWSAFCRFPRACPMSCGSAATAACCWPAAAAAGIRAVSCFYDVNTGKRIAKIGDELDAVLAADINADHIAGRPRRTQSRRADLFRPDRRTSPRDSQAHRLDQCGRIQPGRRAAGHGRSQRRRFRLGSGNRPRASQPSRPHWRRVGSSTGGSTPRSWPQPATTAPSSFGM